MLAANAINTNVVDPDYLVDLGAHGLLAITDDTWRPTHPSYQINPVLFAWYS